MTRTEQRGGHQLLGAAPEDQRWLDPATLPLVAQGQRGDVILAFFTDGRADCTIQQNGERGYRAIGLGETKANVRTLIRTLKSAGTRRI